MWGEVEEEREVFNGGKERGEGGDLRLLLERKRKRREVFIGGKERGGGEGRLIGEKERDGFYWREREEEEEEMEGFYWRARERRRRGKPFSGEKDRGGERKLLVEGKQDVGGGEVGFVVEGKRRRERRLLVEGKRKSGGGKGRVLVEGKRGGGGGRERSLNHTLSTLRKPASTWWSNTAP